jgi:hypothetical protein
MGTMGKHRYAALCHKHGQPELLQASLTRMGGPHLASTNPFEGTPDDMQNLFVGFHFNLNYCAFPGSEGGTPAS